ncbi:hypothetical protein [Streptomyces sp. I05A-00742]|uniref:hypothetical protein n=1 Tax=Streptomyces sp. I05A-00742 TaxID=2732853 RepID=UPI001489D6A4|nr:hypothetical protein [Streptomyces sp. I05A-00742]
MFTSLHETLAAITAGGATWTVFYEVSPLPLVPNVAVRPLLEPAVTTSLAFPAGPPGPALRQLLGALREAERGEAERNDRGRYDAKAAAW